MHNDGSDDGYGTIVYLNHCASNGSHGTAESNEQTMPHADLIIGSGRAGGRMIRIQTFSPNHFVVVRMEFS
eukprot:3016526-Pleurochrysis_carterae.AAC.1